MIRHASHKISVLIGLCITASPVFAEDVLYCTDTAIVGVKWDQNGRATITRFTNLGRFTVRIVRSPAEKLQEGVHFRLYSEKRIVSDGRSNMEMECMLSLGGLVCEDDASIPWTFGPNNTYARAFLAGPPAGAQDPNIFIAHGTCTKI